MREPLPEERESLPVVEEAAALDREWLPVRRALLVNTRREPPLVRATAPPNDDPLTLGSAARETRENARRAMRARLAASIPLTVVNREPGDFL
jgi:hypothetical protein